MVTITEIGASEKHKILRILKDSFLCEGPITVADDGKVSVGGDCFLQDNTVTFLPISFEKVDGNFYCANSNLTSLKGAPNIVGGNFFCYDNRLGSLEYCPTNISKDLICSGNRIKSLEHCPRIIKGNFSCSDNELFDLKLGPDFVSGNFFCWTNPLSSLEGIPTKVGRFIKIEYSTTLPLLRLIAHYNVEVLMPGITGDDTIPHTISKWCQASGSLRSRIIGCQNELIANGFEGNAKW